MAARPWTPEDDTELRRLHAVGATLHAIAKTMGRSKGTISTKAAALELTWEKTRTEAATRSRKAVCAELRAQLEEKYLREAAALLDELRQPVLVYNFGGKDNTYEERQHDEPDAAAKLKLMQASGAAVDRALKLDAHQSSGTADGARSMLGRLGAALGLTPPTPDGDSGP